MAKELIKDGVHDFTTPADYIYTIYLDLYNLINEIGGEYD